MHYRKFRNQKSINKTKLFFRPGVITVKFGVYFTPFFSLCVYVCGCSYILFYLKLADFILTPLDLILTGQLEGCDASVPAKVVLVALDIPVTLISQRDCSLDCSGNAFLVTPVLGLSAACYMASYWCFLKHQINGGKGDRIGQVAKLRFWEPVWPEPSLIHTTSSDLSAQNPYEVEIIVRVTAGSTMSIYWTLTVW